MIYCVYIIVCLFLPCSYFEKKNKFGFGVVHWGYTKGKRKGKKGEGEYYHDDAGG